MNSITPIVKKPHWIRRNIPSGDIYNYVKGVNNQLKLNTVCEEAACPNIVECWNKKQATYIILGKYCSRNCRFCNVSSKKPEPVNIDEPDNIALAVRKLDLNYLVLTSVTRDDLEDYGLAHYFKTIESIRKISFDIKIELLIPDFNGDNKYIDGISNSEANVIGHNIEMVPELYHEIRPDADYNISLKVLRLLKEYNSDIITKSAIMVGLGETEDQLVSVFKNLSDANLDIFYIGQYLQPSLNHVKVKKYYTHDEFRRLKKIAKGFGIKIVKAGPMVRSSYRAEESYERLMDRI